MQRRDLDFLVQMGFPHGLQRIGLCSVALVIGNPAGSIFLAVVFAYKQVDPMASSVFVVNLQDGQEIRIPAELSKVK